MVPVVPSCSPFAAVPVTVIGAAVALTVGVNVPVRVVLSPAASVLSLQVIAPHGGAAADVVDGADAGNSSAGTPACVRT
ncbi:hypothetical protein [Amycolatopsis sp. SID8362]|uniref:hypothetical protein n=1 Tax=Amycolatopsis sp. SID8362 TaxID=2690346 RepID=UPI00136C77F1|nr:hypothetical protein [Amycolatopsis sp. SID8362]NBH06095.1 hypothetical protein [Amycolatopsis sp. SID8362]NED42794.1 hypothetical protein [Amycolatopsis sp. SID8362]